MGVVYEVRDRLRHEVVGLLGLAVGHFEIFLTGDRNLSYQQDLSAFDMAIVVLVAQR
jgi:hypothetical protein